MELDTHGSTGTSVHNHPATLHSESPIITLISNEPGRTFSITKDLLRESIEYFRILFDSNFVDSQNLRFQIALIPGVDYRVEQLLFEVYTAIDRSSDYWLREVSPKASPRQLVKLYRLSSYYDTDLDCSIFYALQAHWEAEKDFTGSKLEALLKSFRALSEESERIRQLVNNCLEQMMRYNHRALIAAHQMSDYEQSVFWPQLLAFCAKRKRWTGMVIPYFRVLQSCPVRRKDHQDLIETELIKFLNEEHFEEMKSHRESNGHQYGDFALHQASLISKFDIQQLVWCWRNWSNSEGEKREEDEGHKCLLKRLQQHWPSLVLMRQDYGFTKEELGLLAIELSMDDLH